MFVCRQRVNISCERLVCVEFLSQLEASVWLPDRESLLGNNHLKLKLVQAKVYDCNL